MELLILKISYSRSSGYFSYHFDNAKVTGIMHGIVNPMLKEVRLFYLFIVAFHKNEQFFPALTIK